MKTLCLIAFVCLGFVTGAQNLPCATIHHSDAEFIHKALKALDAEASIAGITLDRPTNGEGKVLIALANGQRVALQIKQQCDRGVLLVETDGNPRGFVCQKGWIDCMLSSEVNKYCSQAYFDWAAKNCGGAPSVVQ